MSENQFRPQRLWKSQKLKKSAENRSASDKGARGRNEPRSASQKREYQLNRDFKLKSHFNSQTSQLKSLPGYHVSSTSSLSAQSVPRLTSSRRPHSSLGLVRQEESRQPLRSKSSLQVSAYNRSTPSLSQLSARAQSSLGFNWQGSSHQWIDAPQGFDIAHYILEHGPTSGVRIGVNGRESQDIYLMKYVEDCRRLVSAVDEDEEVGVSSGESEEEDDVTVMSHGRSVPLCWNDQLQKAEPSSVKTLTPCTHPSVTRNPKSDNPHPSQSSDKEQNEILRDLLYHQNSITVTITWESTSILDSTLLGDLRLSYPWPNSTRDGKLKNRFSQPNHLGSTQEECDNICENFSSASVPRKSEQGDSEDDDTLPLKRDKATELLPSLLNTVPTLNRRNLLCVWFEFQTDACKELSDLECDVFLTSSSTKVLPKMKFVKVKNEAVVVPLNLRDIEFSGDERKLNLCVMCGRPRSILFTVRLKLPYSPFTAQEGGHDTDATNIQAEIADDYDLPKFFKRRNYCDQEADEDKTDMEALARLFPDLELQDLVDTSTPILSPVHQHVGRLNSMVTQQRISRSSSMPSQTSNQQQHQRSEQTPTRQSYKVCSSENSLTTELCDRRQSEPLLSVSSVGGKKKSEPLSLVDSTKTQNRSEHHLLLKSESTETQQKSEPPLSVHPIDLQHRNEPLSLKSSSANQEISVSISYPNLTKGRYQFQYSHSENKRPLYRPKSTKESDSSSRSQKKSFVAIAEHWLGPYV